MDEAKYLDVFERLANHFGPRQWWPAETTFEVIIGAILTQQVAWRNVETAIANLKRRDVLDAARLLAVPDEELWELIRPTRFFRQKATRLKDFCRVVVDDYHGDLSAFLAQEAGILRARLLGLRGIGKETADSIILYASGQPVFVIDSYTHRIFSRLGLTSGSESYDKLQARFVQNLPQELVLFNEYHALIVTLGHHICRTQTPHCGQCPLNDICQHPNS
ncbi:MAG: endonuclease III domain-containing protein [Eubacteriales bacterium]|jgi:endonuclease-3 related protein|nr:endonuclease III domain-containing protein [Bacillota bacterium]MBV1728286.1 endonuclease III domain-containing protein [Desulforudis sp.]MDP3051689.1 endonuclease III domain-containing protein [Eubacteriales bacterium]MDQ7789023.1 endonuclease III domain-containing protein [Clostridia bacterium]MBU4533834.1 endonuclease III domain-containing protein [Bacillota bacterium]